MTAKVKICGLSTPDSVEAAVAAGAAMVGFVFFPVSPRAITVAEAAALTATVPDGIKRVALSVDADDALLGEITAGAGVDMMQLHGAETPARVADVRAKFGLPVMKVISIASLDDVARAHSYAPVADVLMFDAKPPKDATRPGGNAVAFDWNLIAGETWEKPWVWAGGLTPENVAEAIRVSSAPMVDVSSGVEDGPGIKNVEEIRAFIEAVTAA